MLLSPASGVSRERRKEVSMAIDSIKWLRVAVPIQTYEDLSAEKKKKGLTWDAVALDALTMWAKTQNETGEKQPAVTP
jgi:hypothetical protein